MPLPMDPGGLDPHPGAQILGAGRLLPARPRAVGLAAQLGQSEQAGVEAMTTDCLFCRISQNEVAAHIVYEDERLLAFLDRGPIRPGHTQIMPREHFAYFDDAPADLLAAIVTVGQRLSPSP